jgi:hypothetical protein
MAGRHLATSRDRDAAAEYPSGIPNGGSTTHGRRRDGMIEEVNRISDDTSVTVDMEAMPTHPDVEPSEPRPDALVEHNRVSDGHELE